MKENNACWYVINASAISGQRRQPGGWMGQNPKMKIALKIDGHDCRPTSPLLPLRAFTGY
jgi:hypothetical protein